MKCITVIFLLDIFIAVEGWPCVSPIGRVYSQINTDSVLQFTADLTDLDSPRLFFVKFYDGTIQAVIRYNIDRSSLYIDSQPGVSITSDTTGNVVVTLLDVVQSNAGTYTMDSTGVPLRCNCLYILGTPTKPSITLNKVPSTGESATLTCSSTSTTTPSNHSLGLSYNWTVDNIDNPSGSRYSYSTNRNTLTLSNVVKDDANKLFTCTATEVVSSGYISSRSESFSFDVHYGPENMDFSPSDTSYKRAENTDLNPVTCTANCNPPCSFTWTKIGQAGIIGNTAVLSLGRLTLSEAGTYRCTATRSGRSIQTKDLTVNVIYGPHLSSTRLSPPTLDYIYNEKTTLQDIICSADCYPGCTYTWTKTRQGQTTTVSSTGVLSLGALDPDDAATYICTTENPGKSMSPKTTKQVTVKVRYGPNTANINVLSPYYITEGDTNIHIECSADCYPACSYAWTNLSSGLRTSVNDILSFGTVNRYMTGDYKCTSSNAAAAYIRSSEANISTIVNYAPDVSIRLSTTNIREDESLTLFCYGSGVPSTYVYSSLTQMWNNIEIPNSNTALSGTQHYSSIHFSSLKLEDTGTYTCILNNGIRNTSGYLNQVRSRSMLVEVSPKVLAKELRFSGSAGGTVHIQIPIYSYPGLKTVTITRYDGMVISSDQYNITDHEVTTIFYGKSVSLNGSIVNLLITDLKENDFGSYTFKLSNTYRTSYVDASVVAEGPPLKPKVFLYLSDYSSPTFLWQKDFNGGLHQSFVIQTSVAGTELWTNHTNISERDNQYKINSSFYMANITGLQPGIYSARIFAINTVGESDTVYLEATFEVIRHTEGSTTMPIAAIAGGCALAVVVIVIVVVVLVMLKRRARNKDGSQKKMDTRSESGPSSQVQYEDLQGVRETNLSQTYDSLHIKSTELQAYASLTGKAKISPTKTVNTGNDTVYENLKITA